MADDTRQTPSTPSSDPNERPYQGKLYEGIPSGSRTPATPPQQPQRPESANMLPGGSANTAGGHIKDFTVLDAARAIRFSEFRELHRRPCVRDALMLGITSGAAAGGVTAIWGKPIPKAANWAVGSFCAMSFAAYQICLTRRQYEKQGMQRAVEIIDKKKELRQAKLEEARKLRRLAKEEDEKRQEEERRKAEEKKKWWGMKFW